MNRKQATDVLNYSRPHSVDGQVFGNVRSVITPDTDGKPIVVQTNDYFPFGMSFESPIPNLSYKSTATNKHKYNGKEEQEMPGKWLDYGARFYDAQLGRWHGVDPMCEIARRWTPYQYAYNNPIRYIDPDGMVVDDFYFNKGGKLDKYFENDEPDRVFVATGETTTDANSDSPMPEPVYEQVEMSSEEVEQKMDKNGYAKVVEEEIVEYTEMTSYYTEADGGNREISKDRTSEKVTPTDHMYVKKGAEGNFDVKTKHLSTIDRKHGPAFTIEQGSEKREYTYGTKNTNGGLSTGKKVEIGKLVYDFVKEAISGKKNK